MVKYEEKLALDNKSQIELLTRLWNIEEMIENGESSKVLKEIVLLAEDVRYSAIIDKLEIFK